MSGTTTLAFTRNDPRKLRPHPKAGIIPDLPTAQLDELRESIKTRGILVPVDITKDKLILDGHNRVRIAVELGKKSIMTHVVETDEPEAYMLTTNLVRRHLDAKDRMRALIALLELRRASGRTEMSREERARIAKDTKTSTKTVQRVDKLVAEKPEVVKQVAEGKKSLRSEAYREPTPSPSEDDGRPVTINSLLNLAGKNYWGAIQMKLRNLGHRNGEKARRRYEEIRDQRQRLVEAVATRIEFVDAEMARLKKWKAWIESLPKDGTKIELKVGEVKA